jgi:hypothetical protein
MVISRISGGLGNQLFQYAAGKALATRLGVPFLLDTRWYRNHPERKLLLFDLAIDDKIASEEEIDLLSGKRASLVSKILKRITSGECVLKENESELLQPFFTIKGPAYLNGYWQSYKYFTDVQPVTADLFRPVSTIPSVQKIANEIVETKSISVHVRRGDYVTGKAASQVHGILDDEYYTAALSFLKDKVGDARIFVFSDEIDIARQMFVGDNFVFVSGVSDLAEMYLMSLCKHQIIANSTFSWWAAWLNANPGKIVVAPRIWFLDPGKNSQTANLVPDSWIRI